jgi:hypothetical protein
MELTKRLNKTDSIRLNDELFNIGDELVFTVPNSNVVISTIITSIEEVHPGYIIINSTGIKDKPMRNDLLLYWEGYKLAIRFGRWNEYIEFLQNGDIKFHARDNSEYEVKVTLNGKELVRNDFISFT